MRNEKIVLITKYPDGAEVISKEKEIYAEKKSVGRQEFYAAYAATLNATYVFDILPEEYHLADVCIDEVIYHPSHIRYEGREMKIIRTFMRSAGSLEMTVGK